MKLNLTILILAAISTQAFAGPKVSLLTTATEDTLKWGTANLKQMTPSGVAEFQDFRNYARQVWSDAYDAKVAGARGSRVASDEADNYANGLVKFLHTDKELTVLAPTIKDGKNTALLQQMEIDSSGKMTRTAFEIPPTHESPSSISLTQAFRNGGGGVSDIVAVQRTFDLPSSPSGQIEMTNMMFAKKLEDGKVYRVVLETEVKMGDRIAEASILSNYIHPREINVKFKQVNPDKSDFTNPWINDISGAFKLPEEIKGQVVDLNINAIGTRLTFRTTEGVEYIYAIEKKDPSKLSDYQRDYDAFKFSQISKSKIPGGVNSLLASVKVYPGRAASTKPVKGMEVESAGNSEAGVK